MDLSFELNKESEILTYTKGDEITPIMSPRQDESFDRSVKTAMDLTVKTAFDHTAINTANVTRIHTPIRAQEIIPEATFAIVSDIDGVLMSDSEAIS